MAGLASEETSFQTFGDKACHSERERRISPFGEPDSSLSLRITAKTPLKSVHGRPYLQMSTHNARPWQCTPPYDILSQYYNTKRDEVSITIETKSHFAEHELEKRGF